MKGATAIYDFFSEAKALSTIPLHQREYAWQKIHYSDLHSQEGNDGIVKKNEQFDYIWSRTKEKLTWTRTNIYQKMRTGR